MGRQERVTAYVDALKAEIAMVAALTRSCTVTRVHFGGGSPNALPMRTFADLCDMIRRSFRVAADVEWAAELDPRSLDDAGSMCAAMMRARRAGVGPDLAAQIAITLGLTGQLIAAIEAGQDPKAILVPLREAMRLTEESVTEATVVEDEDEDGSDEVEPEEQPAEPAPPAAVIETTAEEKK